VKAYLKNKKKQNKTTTIKKRLAHPRFLFIQVRRKENPDGR
jgi:hypothetical protein